MLVHLTPHTSHIAGALIFCVSYAVFAFGRVPGTKIDRTAMAVIGATLMMLLGILAPREALNAIDFPTLILLLSMMLLGAALSESGFFRWITEHIIAHVPARHLLPAVLFSSGILSALLVNDVVCVIMTPLVLEVTHRMRRPACPFLMALATASIMASTATIVGNPQNILIASVSHISYLHFLAHLGPVALLGLLADWAILEFLLRKQLHVADSGPVPAPAVESPDPSGEESPTRMLWPLFALLLVCVALCAGISPAASAAGAACLLLLRRRTDPRAMFARVDFSLLLFFVGLFVVLGGGAAVGINERLIAYAEHLNLSNTVIFTAIVGLLSNVVSNVPAVLLLKPMVVQQGAAPHVWLLLAMASTLAGNLTITGSVANIIVVESARREAPLSFFQYLRVGVPVTVITLLIGWAWLRLFPG